MCDVKGFESKIFENYFVCTVASWFSVIAHIEAEITALPSKYHTSDVIIWNPAVDSAEWCSSMIVIRRLWLRQWGSFRQWREPACLLFKKYFTYFLFESHRVRRKNPASAISHSEWPELSWSEGTQELLQVSHVGVGAQVPGLSSTACLKWLQPFVCLSF